MHVKLPVGKEFTIVRDVFVHELYELLVYNSRDKNISILHLSCRTSDLRFSLLLQTHAGVLKSVCNKEHKGVICNMTYKVPYIIAKMIFPSQFNKCIPYNDNKISQSMRRICLFGPQIFHPHPRVILPKALVLCFGKNYSSFLDFTHNYNYERSSGIFVP